MSPLESELSQKLLKRKEAGLLRELKLPGDKVDFYSNDYLGLARSKELSEQIQNELEQLPLVKNGSTGSRLLSGNSKYAEELEKSLAEVFRSESTLLFNSGYTANLAVLSSLPGKDDTIIYDELAHACIKDGARLSLAGRFSFRHNDLDDLESKLKRSKGRRFVAVESIYSMDGDESPIEELLVLCNQYEALLIVDEAHSTGSRGENGGGLAVEKGIHKDIAIRIMTFGKAMGSHGACVATSKIVKDYLVNFARPFIYTTALPPHSIISIRTAFEFLKDNISLQTALKTKVNLYVSRLNAVNRMTSNSSIQTALFPGNTNVKEAARLFSEKGFDIRPILSPTVPLNKERLRICIHTFNSDEDIIQVADTLNHISATRHMKSNFPGIRS